MKGVITMMNEKRKKIMEKISTLPKGVRSPSQRYWCLTCKKLFVLDTPQCPYMTKMCVNTPIAIEMKPPESTISLERFGLFYPKLPQKLMNLSMIKSLVENISEEEKTAKLKIIGKKVVDVYLNFLEEWNITYTNEPLQTIKSLVLFLSGCETAQRNTNDSFLFLMMDVEKVWDKGIRVPILSEAVQILSSKLSLQKVLGKTIKIESIDFFTHLEVGKYFCPMCSMFFEFGPKSEKVTCPLMPQKCMFKPTDIA